MRIELPIGTEVIRDGIRCVVCERTSCGDNPDCEHCGFNQDEWAGMDGIDYVLMTPCVRSDKKCVCFKIAEAKDE